MAVWAFWLAGLLGFRLAEQYCRLAHWLGLLAGRQGVLAEPTLRPARPCGWLDGSAGWLAGLKGLLAALVCFSLAGLDGWLCVLAGLLAEPDGSLTVLAC